MLIAKKKYTEKDYSLLDEGAPFQLIHYDLIMSPSPSPQHQLVSGKLFSAILAYLENVNNLGVVLYSPVDVAFDEGNIFQPDLIYIAGERKAEIIKKRIEGPPDLIIEILSPSNAYYDLKQKKAIYEQYGVKEYIIIDPIMENAEVYYLENGLYVLKQKASKPDILNSVLLPGLIFQLARLFQ